MTYVATPKTNDGGQLRVVTADWDVKELLVEVINQLKIMNIHLSLMTGYEGD